MPDRCALLRNLIRTFFADYLRLVEQEAIGELRLDRIEPIASRAPALVARVHARRREEVTVLVHVEPHALSRKEAGARIVTSLRRLGLPYGCPILPSFVFLEGGRSHLRLESAPLAGLRRIETALVYYTTFGLSAARAEHYLDRPEPLAWALAAGMRPMQRTPDDHHQACLDRITRADLEPRLRTRLRRAARAFGGS